MCGLADETGSPAGEPKDDEARERHARELRARQRRVEGEVADRDRDHRERELGERPRPRFGVFLVGGLAGTWLMAFPSPFDVSLHGLAPVFYALGAAALWALGTVLGRFLALELPFEQVTAVRFALGLPAALAAVLVLGAPLRASLHDELFIALLAIVTGLVALLLYYWGLKRTTASVASLAELTFPVVAIAVGYLAFDATLTSTQLAGVALTSLVVLGLPGRAPRLVREPAHAAPVLAGNAP